MSSVKKTFLFIGLFALGLLGAGWTGYATDTVVWVGLSTLGLITLGVFIFMFLVKLPFTRALILGAELQTSEGYASAPLSDYEWLGCTGHAHSTLRPAGIAEIKGQRVDVVSDGEFINAGEPIRVMQVDGNRIVVQRDLSRHI